MMKPSLEPSFSRIIPQGEDRERDVCVSCGFIDYKNPKIVVGSVLSHGGDVLLCRRAIEPRRDYWTLPAGYLEIGESVEDGARREAFEEACADARLDQVLAIYSVPRISQVQIIFRGVLGDPCIAPGPESLEARLFAWDEIPWADIAFPTVGWALRHWRDAASRTGFPPYGNPVEGP
jgi:ADP-ribose pyrophosphatase YjhB (NUDIX family)